MSNQILLKKENGNLVDISSYDGLKVDFFGKGNNIIISEGAIFHNVHIKARENNHIVIGKTHPRGIRNTVIDLAGSMNSIVKIGNNTSIESARLAMANENSTSITIGESCMLSSNITFRSTDGHVIYSLNSKGAINRSRPIHIGDRVWIGSGATILKGTQVQADSIIATMAVVSKSFDKTNIIIAGNPAKIVKENILWDRTYLRDWE